MEKEIIILTKSIKRHGYCVAGIDAHTGEWIRVISSDPATEHAVPVSALQYSVGTSVDIFDVVQIKMRGRTPIRIQPENWQYDEASKWVKVGESTLGKCLAIHPYDTPSRIFCNTGKSIEESEIAPISHNSLALIQVQEPRLFIKTFERRRYSCNFSYNRENYQYISVTDESVRGKYLHHPDGVYPLKNNTPIVFSLADLYEGKYYKIAAQFLDNSAY